MGQRYQEQGHKCITVTSGEGMHLNPNKVSQELSCFQAAISMLAAMTYAMATVPLGTASLTPSWFRYPEFAAITRFEPARTAIFAVWFAIIKNVIMRKTSLRSHPVPILSYGMHVFMNQIGRRWFRSIRAQADSSLVDDGPDPAADSPDSHPHTTSSANGRAGIFQRMASGGGGGGFPPNTSHASVQVFFPDMAQLALVLVALGAGYLVYRLIQIARNLGRYKKAMDRFAEFANASECEGGLLALQQITKVEVTEAEGAGGRNNADAAFYRISQMHKNVDKMNKDLWNVKKAVDGMWKDPNA